MIFQSVDYLLFFTAVLATYWALPHRAQNWLLLAASYYFYGYVHPWYLLLIIGQTAVSYWGALGVARGGATGRRWLWATVAANLAVLGVFKYFDFFLGNISALLAAGGLANWTWSLNILLPVGISFYTFQVIGYVVDVSRGTIAARRDPLDFALFVAFFPQLVAGPIERASHLLPQVETPRRLSVPAARSAFFLGLWGLFKKLVVADNAAVICNKILGVSDPGFGLLWVGVFAFTVQILADFSAYTDIARASARLLGFDLMENFANPYLAESPADFWKRWHISLSSWIRDYVYIPLGGSRVGPARQVGNVIATFALFGLWHGAAWNFVLWGLYHGVLTLIYRGARRVAPAAFAAGPVRRTLRIVVMFGFTMVGWLIFREHDAGWIAHWLTLSPAAMTEVQRAAAVYYLVVTAIYAAPMAAHMAFLAWVKPRAAGLAGRGCYLATQTVVAAVLLLAILTLSSPVQTDFIYFQF
ncbi:MAG: MBOAT family protein [Vicinamibacterales bacterium]